MNTGPGVVCPEREAADGGAGQDGGSSRGPHQGNAVPPPADEQGTPLLHFS